MNTDQNYVGKGENATSNEPTATQNAQTAQDAAQTPPTADNRTAWHPFDNALQSHQEGLQKAIETMCEETSASHRIELMSSSFYDHLEALVGANRYGEPDRKREYVINDSHINDLYNTFRSMVHVVRIYEHYTAIKHINDIKKAERTND